MTPAMLKRLLIRTGIELLVKSVFIMLAISVLVGLFLYTAPGRIDMTVPVHMREEISQSQEHTLAGFAAFYSRWLGQVAHLDFGRNTYGYRIKDELGPKLMVTGILCCGSAFLSISVSFLFGFVLTSRPGNVITRAGLGLIYLVTATPTFFLAYVMIMLHPFAPGDPASYCVAILVLTVGDGLISELSRIVSGGIREEYRNAYIETAITKGLRTNALLPLPGTVFFHAARQAVIQILPRVGLKIPQIIGLSMIVEKIFSLEGLGGMMLDGLGTKDVNQVLIVTACFTLLVRAMTVLNDALLFALNPKAGK